MGQEQGWAVVPGFGGIPVPVPQIPGIGTGTGTEVCGTSGTGTKNRGTVPSRPLPIPDLNNVSGRNIKKLSSRERVFIKNVKKAF